MAIPIDTDYIQWAENTARLIREGRWDEIDSAALAEEVQDLGKSERSAIRHQLRRLLLHLLKWRYQPERRSDSWLDSINDARGQIRVKIEDSPSLRTYPAQALEWAYNGARRDAASQTGLALPTFPEDSPFAVEAALQENWLPPDQPG